MFPIKREKAELPKTIVLHVPLKRLGMIVSRTQELFGAPSAWVSFDVVCLKTRISGYTSSHTTGGKMMSANLRSAVRFPVPQSLRPILHTLLFVAVATVLASAQVASWPEFQFGNDRLGFNPYEETLGTSNVNRLGSFGRRSRLVM
jgi:hypothetical protein